MQLEATCRCGEVKFSLKSNTPSPMVRCYCSVCRKQSGAGGYSCEIMGLKDSFKVESGEGFIKASPELLMPYPDGTNGPSPMTRYFCGNCGSALYALSKMDQGYVFPFANSIDTPLPKPPQIVHMMLKCKGSWVEPELHKGDETFDEYPGADGIESYSAYMEYLHKKYKCYVE